MGLKAKLIRIMIVVGTLPLILAMVVSYVQGNKSLRGVIGSSFKALAYETSTKIDFMMKEEIRKNYHMANHPGIINYLKSLGTINSSKLESGGAGKDPQMLSLNPASQLLRSFLEEDSHTNKATQALFITDAQGMLSASIDFSPAYTNHDRPAWSKTIQGDKDFAYIGALEQDASSGEYLFEIAVPIRYDNNAVGVLHRVYRAKSFFASWIETIHFGSTGHVMLITSDGTVLDCPVLPTGFKLSDPELVKSVTGPVPDWVETKGNGHDGTREVSLIGYSPLPETSAFTRKSSGKTWFTFAWQASDELFDPTYKLFLWISAAGFFSILLIVMMGSLASDKIVKPIRQLQETAGRIGRGERVEVDKVDIHTGDEIEMLAGEINTMNKMIRAAFAGLEDQVKEKTREVIYLKEYTDGILKSIPDPLLIFNEQLKIEYVNPAFAQFAHIDEAWVIGKKMDEIHLPHHKNWKRLAVELLEHSQGVVPQNPHELKGQFIHCYEPKDPLAAGTLPMRNETTLSFGDQVFAYQFFEVMLQVEESRRIGLLMREITQEKRLQDQLALAEKLSGLGRLSAGIAHEMNNPLYSILGYSEAIIDESDPAKIKTYAGKVLESSKHMAAIIQNLSGYARSNAKDQDIAVNVNERLDAAVEIALVASYSDDIALEKNYSSLPVMYGKPEEIQQIFINIIANAVQAMHGKGKLTLTSESRGENIFVRIQDTGPGIHQEYLQKIFDPFFTTKDQGQGTGLGLNIVHRIVEKYGGKINVETEIGKGTAFVIQLPLN